MRVLDKSVGMDEDRRPVLLITLELPLEVDTGFRMFNGDFMAAFYKALETYEDEERNKPQAGW